ncbi:MAG: hypothetical protein WC317_07850 [Candidatus Omnitrophota bacterium]
MRKVISEGTFIEILEEAKIRLLKDGLRNINSGDEFEAILYGVIKAICAERSIRDHLWTGKHSFPDIYIWPFGIEAKFTAGDAWVTTGNSITEATKIKDLRQVYIFFGKKGKKNKSDIMFRLYEDCLSDIVVTHSPRYKINMELPKGDNIFGKMGTTYGAFCQGDTIKTAKEYYRSILKKGEELWWIDSGVMPIIKHISELDDVSQERFIVEVMVRFPEVFSTSNRKYIKPSLYLLQEYQATCSSFRDLFTAGGQMSLRLLNGKTIKVPKILYNLYINAKAIKKILTDVNRDELTSAWCVKVSKSADIEEVWLGLVDKQGNLNKGEASLIYAAGLRAR